MNTVKLDPRQPASVVSEPQVTSEGEASVRSTEGQAVMTDIPAESIALKNRKSRQRRLVGGALVVVCTIGLFVWWTGYRHDSRLHGKWLMSYGERPTTQQLAEAGVIRLNGGRNDIVPWTFDPDGTGESRIAGTHHNRHRPWDWWTQGDRLYIRERSDRQPSVWLIRSLQNVLERNRGSIVRPQEFVYSFDDDGTVQLKPADDTPSLYLTRITR